MASRNIRNNSLPTLSIHISSSIEKSPFKVFPFSNFICLFFIQPPFLSVNQSSCPLLKVCSSFCDGVTVSPCVSPVDAPPWLFRLQTGNSLFPTPHPNQDIHNDEIWYIGGSTYPRERTRSIVTE